MKRLNIFVCGLVAAFACGDFRCLGQVQISAGIQINSPADFYQPLTPYGSWVDVANYGRCWHPSGVGTDWRPYENGQWVWTDAGWYWQTDEPWGWACYHYGSWLDYPNYGWIWIPGIDWSPAWVTWRQGPDYIGWAPCAPPGVSLTPAFFAFVDVHHFHDHIGPGVLVFNDTRIYDRSHEFGGARHEERDFDGHRRQVVVNPGPRAEDIQRVSGQKFEARPLNEVVRESRTHQENVRPGERGRDRTQPVDREHGTQPMNNEAGRPESRPQPGAAPTPPSPAERPVPPTGREHGDRNVPQQPNELRTPQSTPAPTERPMPSTPNEHPLPPTGHETGDRHAPVTPPNQPSAPQGLTTPTRPATTPTAPPAMQPPIERTAPTPPPQTERPLPPTGRESGFGGPGNAPHAEQPVAPPHEPAAAPRAPVESPAAHAPAPAHEAPARPEGQSGTPQRDRGNNQQP